MENTLEIRLEPCRCMRRWINGLLDDSLRGVVRLYARYHISHCSCCTAALEAMQALRDRLHGLAFSAPEKKHATSSSGIEILRQRLDRLDENL